MKQAIVDICERLLELATFLINYPMQYKAELIWQKRLVTQTILTWQLRDHRSTETRPVLALRSELPLRHSMAGRPLSDLKSSSWILVFIKII
jgi:hypothetical protein